MARMHSKKKGKSKSKKIRRDAPPDWQMLNKDEVVAIVRKLARQGIPPSQIGIILRDQYGVPSFKAVAGVKLMKFLKDENLYNKFPEDLMNLLRKAVRMWNHLKNNKRDIHNKVKYTHVISKIHRLERYYKKKKVIPDDWKYAPDTAALILR